MESQSDKPRVNEQQILQFMTTEHLTLQNARSTTTNESVGRINLYFGAISSVVVALAFIGQASQMGDVFFLFSLVLLPPLFFIGVVTFGRMIDVLVEDEVYARGINRIRHYYLDIAPHMRPYFIESPYDDIMATGRNAGVTPTFWQYFLTASGLVSVVNGIIGGVAIALLIARIFQAATALTMIAGVIAFAIILAAHMRVQSHRFESANARYTVRFPTPSDAHEEGQP